MVYLIFKNHNIVILMDKYFPCKTTSSGAKRIASNIDESDSFSNKASLPSTERFSSSGKEIVPVVKKPRKGPASIPEVFIQGDILSWYKENLLGAKLNEMTADDLRGICDANGLARSGPKYGLINRLRDHVKLAIKSKEMNVMAEQASEGDEAKKYELSVVKLKSFKAGYNACMKLLAKMDRMNNVAKKMEILKGATRGLDRHIFVAITGPRCGFYNGKYDEIGIDANTEITETWMTFMKNHYSDLSVEQFKDTMKFVDGINLCIPYGFDSIFETIGVELQSLLKSNPNEDGEVSTKLEILLNSHSEVK